MGSPAVARSRNNLIKLDKEYRQTEADLETLYEEWENVAQNVP